MSARRTGAAGALCGRDSERHSRPSAVVAGLGGLTLETLRPWVSERRTGAAGALCGRDSERHSRPSAAAAAAGSVDASEPAGRAASSDVSATPRAARPLAGAGGGSVVAASPRAAVNNAVTGRCVCRGTRTLSRSKFHISLAKPKPCLT